MKSLRLVGKFLFVVATVMAIVAGCGSTALANTVDMTLVNVGPNNSGGVYTYPYYFSINGGTPVALICDSFDNRVSIGESWQANETGLLSGKGLFGNELLDYKAAGLIFKSILNGSLGANTGNWAIWGLFSSTAQAQSYFQSSGALGIEQQYLALAANAPNSAFSGLVLYTPLNAKPGSGPQEYIGYSSVPEPATLTMFGMGLLSLGGLVRRKLRRA
jgi:hypothetical protein